MNSKNEDFWENLSPKVKESIDKAQTELENGEGISHEQVMPEIKERVLRNVEEAVNELNMVFAGKLQARNAEDLLDEL